MSVEQLSSLIQGRGDGQGMVWTLHWTGSNFTHFSVAKVTLQSQMPICSTISHQNPLHLSSFIIHPSFCKSNFRIANICLQFCPPIFHKKTRLKVELKLKRWAKVEKMNGDLLISQMPINNHANLPPYLPQPSCLSAIIAISHHGNQPLCQSTINHYDFSEIMPISHHATLTTSL